MTDQLTVRTDRALVRAVHHSTRYALVEVVAPPATAVAVRPRVNVAFVLDRSGSMAHGKLALAKEAVRQGVERLAADDRFAIVVYDTEIDVVAPARLASEEAKREALRALDAIDPRGGTDLGGGWFRGAEQVAEGLLDEGVNRVLLLTDGLANHGMTEPAELTRHASELRARGISTSTFGVGEDFDERLLGSMADAGGGAFRFIGKVEEIAAFIALEVGELLEVTARGATLRIDAPDGIVVEPLAAFPYDRTTHGGTLHLGDLVSDQVVRLVLVVRFPMGEPGREIGIELGVGARDGRLGASSTLTWRFADGAANDAQPRDRDVDRVVARTYADIALRDVVALNREGRWDEARHLLHAVARRIRGYANGDSILRGIVAELERAAEEWSVMRSEMERKASYSLRVSSLKSRDAMGTAERRRQS